MTRRVFVVGATGTVGREVVRALLAQGAQVQALVRSDHSAQLLPNHVVPISGDLTDVESYLPALASSDAAFYVSPHIEQEESCAANFCDACGEHDKRLVFVGSHIDAGSRFTRWLLRAVMGLVMSHYRAKFRLSERVRTTNPRAVLLVPSHFYQNDDLRVVRDGLMVHAAYRQPLGSKALNRVDARDIGEIAAKAALHRDIAPGAYPVVGPRSLSGPDCAEIWSRVLGRNVHYDEAQELFEAGVAEQLEGKKLLDTVLTSRVIKKLAVPTLERQLATTEQLLGRPPTDYEAYARRSIRQWQSVEDPAPPRAELAAQA